MQTPASTKTREWMENTLQTACKLEKMREHQTCLAMEIDRGKDVFCVASTGSGKTVTLNSALIVAQARKECGIGIQIVPTKVLAEQHAEVAAFRGIRALAINEDSVRDADAVHRNLFTELAGGKDIRLGIMTPQMLNSVRMKNLLDNAKFLQELRWFLIDEVHLLEEEASVFAAPYKTLAMRRVQFPPSVVWVCVTATAPPEKALAIARKLGYRPSGYVNARYPVDRPNLTYIPCFYEYPNTTNSHLDFSFLIPFDISSSSDIAPTIIFAQHIDRGYSIMQFLDSLLPTSLPNRLSLIKLYNSIMPQDYRKALKADFTAGRTPILIITETAAYGFDVPRARRMVLADICISVAQLEQLLGRAGRDGEQALVYSFAQEWMRIMSPVLANASVQAKKNAMRRAGLPQAMLDFYNPTVTLCSRGALCRHNAEQFILRSNCCIFHDPLSRGRDLTTVLQWKVFLEQRQASPTVPRMVSDGIYHTLETPMAESLFQLIDRWRHQKWNQINSNRNLCCDEFLPEYTLKKIVERAHLCTTLERLRSVAHGWEAMYIDSHGQELLQFLAVAMTSFNEIFEERRQRHLAERKAEQEAEDLETSSSDMEMDTTHDGLRPGALYLQNHATKNILKLLCRERQLKVTGNKPDLLERLVDYHTKANTPLPTADDIASLSPQTTANNVSVDTPLAPILPSSLKRPRPQPRPLARPGKENQYPNP